MSNVYIGSVIFRDPLMWLNKNDPVIMGVDIRARDGSLIKIRTDASQADQPAKLKYDRVTFAQLETLKYYWRMGGTYSADFEGEGEVYTIRFAAKDGVTWKNMPFGDNAVHSRLQDSQGNSYRTDRYTGELNVIIET
jgi:hypothetical protein